MAELEEFSPVKSSVRTEDGERVILPAEVRRAPEPIVMELPKVTPPASPKLSSPEETVSTFANPVEELSVSLPAPLLVKALRPSSTVALAITASVPSPAEISSNPEMEAFVNMSARVTPFRFNTLLVTVSPRPWPERVVVPVKMASLPVMVTLAKAVVRAVPLTFWPPA